jgi:hypothetical protein
LFYVVSADDSIYALDLKGASPVARRIMPDVRHGGQPYRYLVHAPWGDLLQARRFRREHHPSTLDEPIESDIEAETGDVFESDTSDEEDSDVFADPLVELRTTKLQLYKVDADKHKLVNLDGLGGHALFLGYNGSLCLPVANFPGLKPNTAYIMDDSTEFMNFFKSNKREIGLWDIEDQTFQSLGDASPSFLKEPWFVGVVEPRDLTWGQALSSRSLARAHGRFLLLPGLDSFAGCPIQSSMVPSVSGRSGLLLNLAQVA